MFLLASSSGFWQSYVLYCFVPNVPVLTVAVTDAFYLLDMHALSLFPNPRWQQIYRKRPLCCPKWQWYILLPPSTRAHVTYEQYLCATSVAMDKNRVVRLMFHCESAVYTSGGTNDSMILTRKNSTEYVEGKEYCAGDVCIMFINYRFHCCTPSIK